MILSERTLFAGRFRIARLLGNGGFGEVYAADDTAQRTRVALKVLHAELVSDPLARERFDQESQVTMAMQSPHVVRTLGVGVDGETKRPWIAYELLVGEGLDARLDRDVRLSPALVATLFAQLGEAIGEAHQVGVIHADLKPENLFVTGATSEPVLKVLDFGIARMLKAGRTSTEVQHTVGTPAFTAPEQFTVDARLRASTDVWPLGLLAFQMLTGRHYLRNGGRDGKLMPCLMEVMTQPLPPASERAAEYGLADHLPRDFDAWFRHCVVRDPAQRFQHGRAAVHALLTVLSSQAGAGTTVPIRDQGIDPAQLVAALIAPPAATSLRTPVQTLLARHDFIGALAAIDARHDLSAEAAALRGACNMALGRYDEALDDWSRAIARAPAVSAYLYGRAACFEAQARAAPAEADLALAAALGHEGARQRLASRSTVPSDRR